MNRKGGSVAHSLSLSPTHRPDMPEILLKKDVKSIINPFTPYKADSSLFLANYMAI